MPPPPGFSDLSPATRESLLRGIDAFNAGRWWEAHEAWEDAWLAEEGLTKLWLQGLIQLAAAYHKGLRMGSPRGMASLFEHALEKLEAVSESGERYGGLDLPALCESARRGRCAALEWLDGRRDSFDEALIPRIAPPE